MLLLLTQDVQELEPLVELRLLVHLYKQQQVPPVSRGAACKSGHQDRLLALTAAHLPGMCVFGSILIV